MWVRKETAEIYRREAQKEQEARSGRLRTSLKATALILLIGVLFSILYYLTGYLPYKAEFKPLTLDEISDTIVFDIGLLLLISTIGFLYIYFFGYRIFDRTSDTEMCDSCFSKRLVDQKRKSNICSCGGAFYHHDNYE